MRPHSIPNDKVPGAGLPGFERFQKFVGLIAKVPKIEADNIGGDKKTARGKGPLETPPRSTLRRKT